MEILFLLGLSVAFFSYSLIINLIFLLILSIVMILFLEKEIMTIWGGVMFLIVFLTGLFVIFSYIASTSPKDIDMKKKISLLKSLFFFFFLSFLESLKKGGNTPAKFFSFSFDWSMGGLVFMLFLLIVIIILIRSTYSKGGAFRKKF